MKFLCLSVLVCGLFLYVSADTVLDGVKNQLDKLEDQFNKTIGDFGKNATDGISQLNANKGIFGGIIDSVIQSITNVVSQVTKFFTDPIYDGLNILADGIVKQLNNTINDIEKLQKCGNEAETKIDFTAPLKAVEKCATDTVNQASNLVGEAVTALEQIGSSIGQDVTDTLGCVTSFFNIVNCVGSLINGGLRGARDISNTITVGADVAGGFLILLPQGVGCMAGQFNDIVQNATQAGLDVTKCLEN